MRGINFRSTPGLPARAKELHQSENPGMPFFIGELWDGRSMHWGEPFKYRDPNETAVAFKEALEAGDYPNDAEMVRSADLGVAVSNAHDEVKSSADVIIGSNNEDPMTQIIDIIRKM